MNFPEHEIKNIYKTIEKNVDCNLNFLNDSKTATNAFYKNKKNIPHIRLQKIKYSEDNDLPLGFLDDDILKDIEYCKGILIKNCKNFDTTRNGMISKEEVIQALLQSNINLKIDYNLAKNIIDDYNKTDNVEYMKFIAQLIKDSKLTLIKKNTNSNLNTNYSGQFKNAFSQEKKKPKLKKAYHQYTKKKKNPKKIRNQ